MLAVLMIVPFVLAMLLPSHHLPVPSFMREWLVASALIVTVLYSLQQSTRVRLRMDVIVGMLGLLACTALLQGVMGFATFPAVLMSLGYVVLAILSYQAGASQSGSSRETVVIHLASAMTLGALYSCVLAAFQLYHFSLPFELLFPPSAAGVYGNLAQANHFNDLLWLGLISTCFLMEARVIDRRLAWICLLILVAFSVLSASRSGFIYAISVAAVPWLLGRCCKLSQVRMKGVTLSLLALYLSFFFVFTHIGIAEHFGFNGLAARLGGADTSAQIGLTGDMASVGGRAISAPTGDLRFAFWRSLIADMHVVGAGVGNFRFEMLQHPQVWQAAGLTGGGFEHAHNVIVDLGVEYGWVIMLLVVATGGLWIWQRRRAVVDKQSFWAFNVVAIVGSHAMLEYPLFYTYFLIPFFIALGLLAALANPWREWTVPRNAVALALFGLLILLVDVYRDFQTIDGTFFQFQFGRGNTPTDKYNAFAELDGIPPFSPYKPYASIIKAMLANDQDIRHGVLAKDCENVSRVWLSPISLVNCAASYQLNGEPVKARILMTGVCNTRPGIVKELVAHFSDVVAAPFGPDVLAGCHRIDARRSSVVPVQ